METQLINKASSREPLPALVVGAGGVMGNNYIQKLIAEGFAPQNIIAVDIDPEKLKKLEAKYPGIQTASKIPEITKFGIALVVPNTPAHLSSLEELSLSGSSLPVLVEKPVISTAQLERSPERVLKLAQTLSSTYVAYLINFSPAMEALLKFMSEQDLVVIEGTGRWGKNRTGDTRPTAGDLEDEMTHPLAALMVLARQNQNIHDIEVTAKLTHLNFVDKAAQENLARQDESIPMRPNSTSSLCVEFKTSRAALPVALMLQSSFTAPEQSRVIEVTLSDGSPDIKYVAQITFDEPSVKGDVLKIWKYPKKNEPGVTICQQTDNLGSVVRAFLRAAQYGESHPALKTLKQGLSMVEIAAAANRSNQEKKTVFLEAAGI